MGNILRRVGQEVVTRGISAGRIYEQKPVWCEEVNHVAERGMEFQQRKH